MPSRKRNKGKERKAKKAELEAEVIVRKRAMARKAWQGWARVERDVIRSAQFITQCNHGCALMIPDDANHPVTSFVDVLFMNCFFGQGKHTVDNLDDSFGTQLAVWNDDRHRKITIDLMIVIATNMILGKADVLRVPRDIAYAVMMLENYDGSGEIDSTINSRVVATKIRDFGCGGSGSPRDVLKFYRKRTTCKCLKDMHLEARKTHPKLGECTRCEVVKERRLLMVCSKCRYSEYCSRKCQTADWSRHKCSCDIFCDAHQRSRRND